MTFDEAALTAEQIEHINGEASALMKQGISLMNQPEKTEHVAQALECFDQALEMRQRLPSETSAMLSFGLAACWLNRADALVRLSSDARLAEALSSYDSGIEVLNRLPLAEDARFPRRLAIAHQNRGLLLQIQGKLPQSLDALKEATGILEKEHSKNIEDRDYLLAAMLLNFANVCAQHGEGDALSISRDAARRALSLIANLEEEDFAAAEVGLKARHVLCQILAALLSQTGSDDKIPIDVHEATDLADDGLQLVRHWELRGISQFRYIAYDLFRFGARLYAVFQPHFLNEFAIENLDASRSSEGFVDTIQKAGLI